MTSDVRYSTLNSVPNKPLALPFLTALREKNSTMFLFSECHFHLVKFIPCFGTLVNISISKFQ